MKLSATHGKVFHFQVFTVYPYDPLIRRTAYHDNLKSLMYCEELLEPHRGGCVIERIAQLAKL